MAGNWVPIANLKGPKGDPGDDGEVTAEQLQAHVDDPTPHPTYDNIPNLRNLYRSRRMT